MALCLLTEPANKLIKKSILGSNSNHLPTQSRDGGQVLAEQESDNNCNHFTIRHYVSEVRKENAKNCWPFPMPDRSSADHANALPPLRVKRFRRWDCRRCARLIVAPKIVISNGVNTTSVIPHEANMTSQSDHGSKNHDTSRIPRVAPEEEEKSFARTESSALIKEVISHSEQNRTSKPNAEACQTREKGSITVRESSSRFALPSDDKPKILSSKRGKTVLVHLNDISDKEEDRKLSKIGKGKELSSLIDLTECNGEGSDTSIHFIDARKPVVSVEKSLPRRARKIRTINDIMESAASHKVDKNPSSSENMGAGVMGSTQIPEASKDNDEHPKHGGHQIQDEEPMSIKRKKKEAVSNEGEGTCLIHWLKKVPKKARLHKGELEAKAINNETGMSECVSLKGLDLNLEYSARGEKKKEINEEKQRNVWPEVVKSSFKPQQEGRDITEDQQAKNRHSRSPGIIISEKDFRHIIATKENNDKKSLLGNKKNKRPYAEEGASSQPRCFKDSLGIQEQAFAQTREVKREQRTIWTLEREDVDDIPMDIVEHLAKKQHEKYFMNAKEGTSNLCKLPESIENVQNLNGCSIGGYDARISTKSNGDTESRSKSKQYHLFDLNQEAPTCASTELQLPSPYIGLSMSGVELTIIDSNRNYFPQNLSAVGMKTLPFRLDHTNQTVSPQNLFGNIHVGGSLSGYPLHINAQNSPYSFACPSLPESRNVCYSNLMAPGDMHFNETMSASSFLRIVNQSAHSGDPHLSLLCNGCSYTFNSHDSEFLQSEIENDRGGNMCKPLRPIPRIGIIGPLLQKEITNTSNNMRPTLGFGLNSQLSFHNTGFMASIPKPPTPHKTMEKVMNAQTSISRSESWKRIDNNGQVLTESRNGAFQPLKSACEMEECVVNRNPADFAMVDEDSEYMIGYKDTKAEPHSGKLQSRAHMRGQKGQKMRKLSEIKRSRKSKKAPSRGKV